MWQKPSFKAAALVVSFLGLGLFAARASAQSVSVTVDGRTYQCSGDQQPTEKSLRCDCQKVGRWGSETVTLYRRVYQGSSLLNEAVLARYPFTSGDHASLAAANSLCVDNKIGNDKCILE